MRALTMDELSFVSGGFLSENGEARTPELVVIREVRRTDPGMTEGTFNRIQAYERSATTHDMLCGQSQQLFNYLRAEAAERDPVGTVVGRELSPVVEFTVDGFIAKLAPVIGWPLIGGTLINKGIAGRYQSEADTVARYMGQNGCVTQF
jgi:hypothetical protein